MTIDHTNDATCAAMRREMVGVTTAHGKAARRDVPNAKTLHKIGWDAYVKANGKGTVASVEAAINAALSAAQCEVSSDSIPSQNAFAGSSGIHPAGELTPLPEGVAEEAPPAIQLANRIKIHLALKDSSPGFHLSDDDLKLISDCLSRSGVQTKPVAWLAEWDGNKAATVNPDTMREWRDKLKRKITPLYTSTVTSADRGGEDGKA